MEKVKVGDDPTPTDANQGGAGKRRWLRSEAQEVLPEEVVHLERGLRRRRHNIWHVCSI
jgi:hypothetical protein